MSRALIKALRVFVATSIIVVGVTGCTAASEPTSSPRYLQSLDQSHRIDGRAKEVCLKNQGTPTSSSTRRVELLVAADSTLKIVREIVSPGYAEKSKDSNLLSKKQGYAAICLIKTTSYGKPARIWEFELPDGSGNFLYTGGKD